MICTYNGEAYLSKVFDAIYNQNRFKELVEEVILVDNASKDKTKEITFEYKKKYDNLRYIYEAKPGVANARRHVRDVKTKWCIFVDDDNVLLDNFLDNLDNYIVSHPSVGVVNSNSIAYPDFKLKNDEEHILRAILPCIACTHFSKEDVHVLESEMNNNPFGAGMAFLVEPLIKFESSKWMINDGRTGDDLQSGEDGEIARIVLKDGYEYGYNKNSSMYHIVPKFRIQKDYIKRLKEGLVEGTYIFISSEDNYIIKRIYAFIVRIIMIILFPIQYLLCKDPVKQIKLKLGLCESFLIVKYILRDLFVMKRY